MVPMMERTSKWEIRYKEGWVVRMECRGCSVLASFEETTTPSLVHQTPRSGRARQAQGCSHDGQDALGTG